MVVPKRACGEMMMSLPQSSGRRVWKSPELFEAGLDRQMGSRQTAGGGGVCSAARAGLENRRVAAAKGKRRDILGERLGKPVCAPEGVEWKAEKWTQQVRGNCRFWTTEYRR